jgi:hypothetical protein
MLVHLQNKIRSFATTYNKGPVYSLSIREEVREDKALGPGAAVIDSFSCIFLFIRIRVPNTPMQPFIGIRE